MLGVLITTHPGVLDHAGVPNGVQVAGVSPTTLAVEKANVNAVSASRFQHRMHGLVNIANEMDNEFQCFRPVVTARMSVGQDVREISYFDHDAALRKGAITLGIIGSAQWNSMRS